MANYFLGQINDKNLKDLFAYDLGQIAEEEIKEVSEYEKDQINIERLLDKDILKKFGLEWAIIYCYDRIVTDSIDNLAMDIENITEARFFNEKCELKIWRDEDIFKGVVFKELKSDPEPIEEDYILYPRGTGGSDYNKLKVKKYLDYDDDGQAYIAYIKPFKFE